VLWRIPKIRIVDFADLLGKSIISLFSFLEFLCSLTTLLEEQRKEVAGSRA
jgi:hypothetical protein